MRESSVLVLKNIDAAFWIFNPDYGSHLIIWYYTFSTHGFIHFRPTLGKLSASESPYPTLMETCSLIPSESPDYSAIPKQSLIREVRSLTLLDGLKQLY